MTHPSEQPRYNVIFRTCDAVFSVNGAPRPFGLDKRSLIKLCFVSLYEAIKDYPHTIHVLGDKLSGEMQEFFEQFPVTLTNGSYGNDESIRQSIRLGLRVADDEWVYLCEDDYLHSPQAFCWIDDLLRHRAEILTFKPRPLWTALLVNRMHTRPLVLHPPDYPDRYRDRYRHFSMLFVSNYCHWRQVDSTTFTILLQAASLKRFEDTLLQSATGANDYYLSRRHYARYFWRGWRERMLCLSPIPGIATHLHSDVMTPLVDWRLMAERLIERYPAQLGSIRLLA